MGFGISFIMNFELFKRTLHVKIWKSNENSPGLIQPYHKTQATELTILSGPERDRGEIGGN